MNKKPMAQRNFPSLREAGYPATLDRPQGMTPAHAAKHAANLLLFLGALSMICEMISALIVAAGKGTRMGPDVEKLFLPINGCPVVGHTWRTFDSCSLIEELVIVVREGQQESFAALGVELGLKKPVRFVAGGKERQDSVWNGLQALSPEAEIVAIQDAARPCTSLELIAATIEAARQTGAAVAAQPLIDTVKQSSDGFLVGKTLDRSQLWTVQTPQTFRVPVIRRALWEVRNRGILVTDDTAACELIGEPVRLVAGAHPNPKVTRPEDLPYIEMLLRREPAQP
jgi:2-C-methyl-D-erythritol 4-phosphate cytidylyltransferase